MLITEETIESFRFIKTKSMKLYIKLYFVHTFIFERFSMFII